MAEQTAEERVVADRYALCSVRGRGGMGTVWEAEDRLLERRVAVKEVPLRDRGSLGDEGVLRQRVLREARVAAKVSHPSLVTIYDVVDGGDRVYLVQEYVDAPTLHEVVTNEGPLEPAAAARIGQQVLGALDALHQAGIVHRDVKPSNVMVLPNGGVKVADFGIALVEDDRDLTLAGSVLGSPGYLAPEQASGRRAEAAADLWSLGATLWFAVEGRGPYGDTPGLAALGEVVHGPVPTAARARALAPVLAAAMRKDPGERASADELHALLEAAATPAPAPPPVREPEVVAPTIVAAAVPAPEAPPATPPPPRLRRPPAPQPPPVEPPPPRPGPPAQGWQRPGEDREARSSTAPWLLGLVAAVVLIALVAAGLALASSRDDGETRAASPGGASTTAPAAAPASTATAAPSTTSRRATSTTAAPSDEGGGGATPAGWQRFENAEAGYSVAYPAGWQVRRGAGNVIDLTDPSSGTYLRLDWSDKPKDPVEAWRDSSKAFGAKYGGYEEIRLEETTFKGMDGAIWEYRYSAGGGRLHASNLTFVASENRAYALNFQTADSRWEAEQGLRKQLEDSFQVTKKSD